MLSEIQSRSFSSGFEQVWSADKIASLLKSSGVLALVVSEKEQPLGFMIWREVADEMEILSICILPEHRGKGLGKDLLSELHVQAKARKIQEIFLEVRSDNVIALHLYEKQGYKMAGKRKNYYQGPDGDKRDAFIMKYPII